MFSTSMIADRIGRHEDLLPIDYKNYGNFRENKKSQVMEERENSHHKTDKGGANCLIGTFRFYDEDGNEYEF